MNPVQPLSGKHALVTGAARGIGLACARRLLAAGAQVTLLGRNEDALRQAVATLGDPSRCRVQQADVADRNAVNQAFSRAAQDAGPIDILVNNAGQATSERFERTSTELWRTLIEVNLSGVFHCSQAALPAMLQRGWGRIVNIASTAGLTGYPYVSAYCAAKHGVVGLTRALALETARKGVTVNAVCPGYTETDIVRSAVRNIVEQTGKDPRQALEALVARNPQGRLVQPEEVAEAVLWLCLPASAAVTGQALPVDGGEVMAG